MFIVLVWRLLILVFQYTQGGFGSVHLVKEKISDMKYAMKVLPRTRGASAKMIQREFLILQEMQHQNVVRFKYCLIKKYVIVSGTIRYCSLLIVTPIDI